MLYCFAPAGGSAANYLSWEPRLGPEVAICAVQLPGHGTRCFEPPWRDFGQIVERLAGEIAGDARGAFALFGHSLGGLLAFEVARLLEHRGSRSPSLLMISGCDPPTVERRPSELSQLPDAELIERLRSFNGTPAELLADQDFMSLVLPAIRADFELAGGYRYRAGERLKCNIVVMNGIDDHHAPPQRAMEWSAQAHEVRMHQFAGGHFFHLDNLPAILQLLKREVRRSCSAAD